MKPKIKFNGFVWVVQFENNTSSLLLDLALKFAFRLNNKQNRYKDFIK